MDAMNLTRADVDEITQHLDAISARIPLRPIKTKRDYKAATSALNALLDAGGANEKSPLASLVTMLGDFISDYEEAQSESETIAPADVLRFLMD